MRIDKSLTALILAVLAVSFVAAPSAAQDAPRAPNWSGLYAGIIAGGINTRGEIDSLTSATVSQASSHKQAFGAVTGYAWQAGPWVFGLEVDWSRIPGTYDDRDLYSARARAGWTYGNALFYGTAGVGSEDVYLYRRFTGQAPFQTGKEQFVGVIAGGGFEAMLPYNLSVRAEGLYFSPGKQKYDFPAGTFNNNGTTGFVGANSSNFNLHQSLYRVGLTYHFN